LPALHGTSLHLHSDGVTRYTLHLSAAYRCHAMIVIESQMSPWLIDSGSQSHADDVSLDAQVHFTTGSRLYIC
jgi:hypothetical protein